MPTLKLENQLKREHPELKFVVGLDEVGVAPFAGPLVAAAVILPPREKGWYGEIDDSKNVSAARRERLAEWIRRDCVWGIGSVTSKEVDEIGPMKGRVYSMRRAYQMCLARVKTTNVGAVVDGESLGSWMEELQPAIFVNKGDQLSISVAAASVVAKFARDTYMQGLAMLYPHWGFETNVGYGTPAHMKAIKLYGLCPEHRLRWRPVRQLFSEYIGEEATNDVQ